MPLQIALAGISVLLLVGGAVLALSLSGVRDDLVSTRVLLSRAQDALGQGDRPAAATAVRLAGRKAGSARRATQGPLWSLYAHLPVVGTSVREVRALTVAADTTTNVVLPDLLALDPGSGAWTGVVDVRPFVAAQVPLARAEVTLKGVRGSLRSAPAARVRLVGDARRQLEAALTRLARSITEARVSSRVVPEIASGDKTFLVAVQNNAEQRATGGLIGAYALLHLTDGRVRLDAVGPNQDLHDPTLAPIDLGPEYDALYGRFASTTSWRSANLSPDTPTVGRLLAALWQRQGKPVDGVMLVDPVALARLLVATGPVTLGDGTRITSHGVVKTLLVDAYARFSREQDADRNSYLQQATRKVVERLSAGGLSGRKVMSSLAAAAGSGHLQVWSADEATERQLMDSRVGGALRFDGPFLEVVSQDVGGSKLDIYQQRRVIYEAAPTGESTDLGGGPVPEENAKVTVQLENGAPVGLPEYVTLRPDDPRAPVGESKCWLSIYLGRGATAVRATLDGQPVALESGTEQGLSVFSVFVSVPRGHHITLTVSARQPGGPDQALTYRQQPSVLNDEVIVHRAGASTEFVYDR